MQIAGRHWTSIRNRPENKGLMSKDGWPPSRTYAFLRGPARVHSGREGCEWPFHAGLSCRLACLHLLEKARMANSQPPAEGRQGSKFPCLPTNPWGSRKKCSRADGATVGIGVGDGKSSSWMRRMIVAVDRSVVCPAPIYLTSTEQSMILYRGNSSLAWQPGNNLATR